MPRATGRRLLGLALAAAVATGLSGRLDAAPTRRRPLRISPAHVARLHLLGVDDPARDVVMTLRRDTRSEVHRMLQILREIGADTPPGSPRVRVRVIPATPGVLAEFPIKDPTLREYLVVEDFQGDDLWVQDWGVQGMIELAKRPGLRPAVLHTGRARGLRGFAEHLAGRTRSLLVRTSGQEEAGDFGGNLLALPRGRMLVGDTCSERLRALLHRTGPAGRVVELPTQWLRVGHLDEMVAVLPAPGTSTGFVLAYAAPRLALRLLADLEDDATHGVLTALRPSALGPRPPRRAGGPGADPATPRRPLAMAADPPGRPPPGALGGSPAGGRRGRRGRRAPGRSQHLGGGHHRAGPRARPQGRPGLAWPGGEDRRGPGPGPLRA